MIDSNENLNETNKLDNPGSSIRQRTNVPGYKMTIPPMISIGSIVQRIDEAKTETEFEESLIVLDLEKSNYHNLNVTGNVIWQRLDKPICVSELVSNLCSEYNCSRAKCKSDTLIYLHQLLARNLLRIIQ